MSEIIVIIDAHRRARPLAELELAADVLVGDRHDANAARGVIVDEEDVLVFVEGGAVPHPPDPAASEPIC